jgi:hypothetical protein
MEKINRNLIAPCGMNCAVCRAYLRDKNRCDGCSKIETGSPKTCVLCRMRTCTERKGKYCFDCSWFPCERLKHMDKRYRTKYGMSQIENLKFIRDHGINDFIKNERIRWQSAKGIFCVHDKKHYR